MPYLLGRHSQLEPRADPLDRDEYTPVNGAGKLGHWGGGIVYHRHDEKGLKWEPGGVMSGAGVCRSGVSQESSGSSETWEATPCRLWRRR